MVKIERVCCLVLVAQFIMMMPGMAQPKSDVESQTIYSLGGHSGTLYAHSFYVQNVKGAKPYGAEVSVAKLPLSQKTFNIYGCFLGRGISVSYIDFNTPILGKSLTASAFLSPTYRLSSRADFYVKGGAGASYLTAPYNSVTNTENRNYGSHANIYVAASAGFTYKTGKHLSVTLSGNYLHNSNGGFKTPNRGVNYPTASLALNYVPQGNTLPRYTRLRDTAWRSKRNSYEAAIFYSPKQGYDSRFQPIPQHLAGAAFQYGRRVAGAHALTAAAEVYYDGGMKTIKQYYGDSTNNWFAGILAGHEFIIGKLNFSQQLGIYLHYNTKSYTDVHLQVFDVWYHRWGVKYAISPKIKLGFNLLAHRQVADFIDARLIYAW